MSSPHEQRLKRAHLALAGLSVGDAFGQQFFVDAEIEARIAQQHLPPAPWTYTDDTEMALAVVDVLTQFGTIEPTALAQAFAQRYHANPNRGYGGTAHSILQALHEGVPWPTAAGNVFGGQGSMGNGAAMRVAPIGAYWADDYAEVVRQASASASVTHAHPDGQAGAIAVAIAAAWAWRYGAGQATGDGRQLLEVACAHTPPSATQRGLEHALLLPAELSVATVGQLLGVGWQVTAPDTVPFALWCAARHWNDYSAALWTTVAGLGDRDTTCAIVGGVVALATGWPGIPAEWLVARETLV